MQISSTILFKKFLSYTFRGSGSSVTGKHHLVKFRLSRNYRRQTNEAFSLIMFFTFQIPLELRFFLNTKLFPASAELQLTLLQKIQKREEKKVSFALYICGIVQLSEVSFCMHFQSSRFSAKRRNFPFIAIVPFFPSGMWKVFVFKTLSFWITTKALRKSFHSVDRELDQQFVACKNSVDYFLLSGKMLQSEFMHVKQMKIYASSIHSLPFPSLVFL